MVLVKSWTSAAFASVAECRQVTVAINSKAQLGIHREDRFACLDP